MGNNHRITLLIRKDGIVNSLVENRLPSKIAAENRVADLVRNCVENGIEVLHTIVAPTKERTRRVRRTGN